eukprot:Skav204846  [mRNA]  locus=scaffold1883:88315:89666:- [translate_table: standard]
MGWFYKIDEDCNLTSLGLAFNGTTGNIFGRTKLYDEDDPLLSVDCEVRIFQDVLRGVATTAPLEIEVQGLSYGLKKLTFSMIDGDPEPVGQSSFDLQSDPSLAFQSFSVACVPVVPWISVNETTGRLTYIGDVGKTGGLNGLNQEVEDVTEEKVYGDSARCTLTGFTVVPVQAQSGPLGSISEAINTVPEDPIEVILDFQVQRVWVWSGMRFDQEEIVIKKNEDISPIELNRRPPDGFSVYASINEDNDEVEVWYKQDDKQYVKIPPAKRPDA